MKLLLKEGEFVFILERPNALIIHELRQPDAKERFYKLLKRKAAKR